MQNKLGADGYPVLNKATTDSDESLAYLFNGDNGIGKHAYLDVKGLLQVDDERYYTYDSTNHFAEFNTSTKNFTLYEEPGVYAYPGKNQKPVHLGQFFPFNTAEQVFTKDFISNNRLVNHYFGVHMNTRFIQQYEGHTDKNKTWKVTYNFSGDDDVWIFIDGVLVGDLGGNHDALSIQIDFSSGEVITYEDRDSDNQYTDQDGKPHNTTTLAKAMEGTGKPGFRDHTFADGTYHTLDFFYLERGGINSNMSLKYNLVNLPESDIVKMDQDGKRIPGVGFELYPATVVNGVYTVAEDAKPRCIGTTNSVGELVLMEEQANGGNMPVQLSALGKNTHWVLRETSTPPWTPQLARHLDHHQRT
ncbi:hypothetical protein H7U32_04395 [Bifidobacterium pullorum subsp. saeculare]|uniref:PA14 domain-containing protein n=1 Tax=Bifidobacterium pullorum subsp. saeculare TaxID=78257 RepID=A0A938WXS3_9BIFI|nr:hypothetical protein [Bifidobacterium pullorum]MBM6699568.1 hypothetical protein [Bifidobacterium pullorum subsp. saeculare]